MRRDTLFALYLEQSHELNMTDVTIMDSRGWRTNLGFKRLHLKERIRGHLTPKIFKFHGLIIEFGGIGGHGNLTIVLGSDKNSVGQGSGCLHNTLIFLDEIVTTKAYNQIDRLKGGTTARLVLSGSRQKDISYSSAPANNVLLSKFFHLRAGTPCTNMRSIS